MISPLSLLPNRGTVTLMLSRSSSAVRKFLRHGCLLVLFLTGSAPLPAEVNNFDLLGPRIEMKVTRNGKPLPISDVANLQPGHRLLLHPDFPDDQSARYLLIVAFLRGATNPPPENWF